MTPFRTLGSGLLFVLLLLPAACGGGGGGGDAPPPLEFVVQTTDPRPGTATLGDTASVTVLFTKPVSHLTMTPETIRMTNTSSGLDHSGVLSLSDDAKRITWSPRSRMDLRTTYRLSVSTGVESQLGESLARLYETTFTTGGIPDPAFVQQSDFRTLQSRMRTGRSDHTATLIEAGGKKYVVLVGGFTIGRSQPTGSAEFVAVEDLEVGNDDGFIFASGGSMPVSRAYHTATAYRPGVGLVLVAGGGTTSFGTTATSDARIWTLTGGFKETGSLNIARRLHAATLIEGTGTDLDGSVLVTGGRPIDSAGDTAEIWDPVTEKWTLLPDKMNSIREGHEMLLLSSGPLAGRVLIVGGGTDIAEVFDPATRRFIEINALTDSFRWMFGAVELKTSQVLLTGGGRRIGELFDPVSLTFASTPSEDSLERYGAIVHRFDFPPGRQPPSGGPADNVLIVGGATFVPADASWITHGSVEQFILGTAGTGQYYAFDPAEGGIDLGDPRAFAAGCGLGDGRLIVTGGIPSTGIGAPTSNLDLDTVLIFDPQPDD